MRDMLLNYTTVSAVRQRSDLRIAFQWLRYRMSTTVTAIITEERPDTADAMALILELESHLATRYPQESRHGFSVEKLIRDGVAFFVARLDSVPVGCGGVLLVGADYG